MRRTNPLQVFYQKRGELYLVWRNGAEHAHAVVSKEALDKILANCDTLQIPHREVSRFS